MFSIVKHHHKNVTNVKKDIPYPIMYVFILPLVVQKLDHLMDFVKYVNLALSYQVMNVLLNHWLTVILDKRMINVKYAKMVLHFMMVFAYYRNNCKLWSMEEHFLLRKYKKNKQKLLKLHIVKLSKGILVKNVNLDMFNRMENANIYQKDALDIIWNQVTALSVIQNINYLQMVYALILIVYKQKVISV